MTKQQQTIYVPCYGKDATNYLKDDMTNPSAPVMAVQVFLYTPEEHAQVIKMRKALEQVAGICDDSDSKEASEIYAIAQRALYLK